MLTIWTSTATHHRWAARAVVAAFTAAIALTGLAMASQAHASESKQPPPQSVRWR